jgi:hypothetical protein
MKHKIAIIFLLFFVSLGWSVSASAGHGGGHGGGHGMGNVGHVGGFANFGGRGGHFHPGGHHWGYSGGYPWVWGGWGWPNYSYYPYGYGYSFYNNYSTPYYATYAAISYSPSLDLVGYSVSSPTLWAAVQNANAYCGANDCRSVVWVRGGCAVFTTNNTDNRTGYAWSVNRWIAEQSAMNACTSGSVNNPKDCVQRAWACSF